MGEFQFYEHVPGIIGIKTNAKRFRWGFGKCQSPVCRNEYERCKIKVNLRICNDNEVFKNLDIETFSNAFRYFRVKPGSQSLIFEKKIDKVIRLRFFLSVASNNVEMVVGKSYARIVQSKIMYFHPVPYILFDVVSMLLLKNGMTTLYGSSVCMKSGKTLVCVSPPNTGKSLTALRLNNQYEARIISEDMAVTDGTSVWGASDTNLYRRYHDKTIKAVPKSAMQGFSPRIDYVFILQKGARNTVCKAQNPLAKCLLINRYSLGYYYSPVLRALDYYNEGFSTEFAMETEKEIFQRMQKSTEVFVVENENSFSFADTIAKITK